MYNLGFLILFFKKKKIINYSHIHSQPKTRPMSHRVHISNLNDINMADIEFIENGLVQVRNINS